MFYIFYSRCIIPLSVPSASLRLSPSPFLSVSHPLRSHLLPLSPSPFSPFSSLALSVLTFFLSHSACVAVIATILTMSLTEQPLDKSLIGAAIP